MLLPLKEPNIYYVRRVHLRCDIIDTLNDGIDGRLKELFYPFPGGEITIDFQRMRRGGPPRYMELPILDATTCVIVPRRAEFHEMGFTAVREDLLQPSIEALCESREILFIAELGVLELR